MQGKWMLTLVVSLSMMMVTMVGCSSDGVPGRTDGDTSDVSCVEPCLDACEMVAQCNLTENLPESLPQISADSLLALCDIACEDPPDDLVQLPTSYLGCGELTDCDEFVACLEDGGAEDFSCTWDDVQDGDVTPPDGDLVDGDVAPDGDSFDGDIEDKPDGDVIPPDGDQIDGDVDMGEQCNPCDDTTPCGDGYVCIGYGGEPPLWCVLENCGATNPCPRGSSCIDVGEGDNWCIPDEAYECDGNDLYSKNSCGISMLATDCDDDTEVCNANFGTCDPIGSRENDCTNEIDDDNDGKTDCEDIDCGFDDACENTGEQCALCDAEHPCAGGYVCIGYGGEPPLWCVMENCDDASNPCPEGSFCYDVGDGQNWCIPEEADACVGNDLYIENSCGITLLQEECGEDEVCSEQYGSCDPVGGRETDCDNEIDDDNDGKTDCEDTDCGFDPACPNNGEQCDICDQDHPCANGYDCIGYTDADFSFCVLVCDSAACAQDMTCMEIQGNNWCVPGITGVDCMNNDVYYADTCDFHWMVEDCADSQVCNPADEGSCDGEIDGDIDVACDLDCTSICTENGYDSGECIIWDGGPTCSCSVADCSGVAQMCTDLLYNNCTCAAADPCSWQADAYCDDYCETAYPDDYFDDSADCGVIDGDVIDGDIVDGDVEPGEQCDSCGNNAPCAGGYVCIAYTGSDDSFCVKDCADDNLCPEGATCGDPGNGEMWCLPDIDESACIENDLNLTDTCENEILVDCKDGAETCNADTRQCDANATSEDICDDNADNDEDGFTDCEDYDCLFDEDCGWTGEQCSFCDLEDVDSCAAGYDCYSWVAVPDQPWCAKQCQTQNDCPADSTCYIEYGYPNCVPDTVGLACTENDLYTVDSCDIQQLDTECDDATEVCNDSGNGSCDSTVDGDVDGDALECEDLLVQTPAASGNGLACQNFEGAYDTYDVFKLDDFTVPSGESWDVWRIHIDGQMAQAATGTLDDATQFHVAIFDADNGLPAGGPAAGIGSAVWTGTWGPNDATVEFDNLMSSLDLSIPGGHVFTEGSYWLAFWPDLAYEVAGQWFWNVSDTSNGATAMSINPGGGFGGSTDYEAIDAGDVVEQDMAFALLDCEGVIIDGDEVDGDEVDGDMDDMVCEGSCDGSLQSWCIDDDTLCWCDATWADYNCLEACIGAGYSGTLGCTFGAAEFPQCICTDVDGDVVDGDVIDGDAECPLDCDTDCAAYGYDSGTCIEFDGDWNCACEMDVCDPACTGYYDNCSCDAADPCEWQGDAVCDDWCAAAFPDNHFDDTADCGSVDGDVVDGDVVDGDIDVDGAQQCAECEWLDEGDTCSAGYTCLAYTGDDRNWCALTIPSCDCPEGFMCYDNGTDYWCVPDPDFTVYVCQEGDVWSMDTCQIDFLSDDCHDVSEYCNSEVDPAACESIGGGEMDCINEIDDDEDSLTDCEDPDCILAENCSSQCAECEWLDEGDTCPEGYTCLAYTGDERKWCALTVPSCDCPDGFSCYDNGTDFWCVPDEAYNEYVCQNDDVYYIDSCELDYLSADCHDVNDFCDDSQEPPVCSQVGGGEDDCGNEIDDDQDGATDCEDYDCAFLPQCCEHDAEISCGDALAGNNADLGESVYEEYSCTSYLQPGPEVLYKLTAPADCNDTLRIDVALSDLEADLDLMVLDTCSPESCIGYVDSTGYFDAEPGAEYYLAVDGYGGAVSNYTLTVTCECVVLSEICGACEATEDCESGLRCYNDVCVVDANTGAECPPGTTLTNLGIPGWFDDFICVPDFVEFVCEENDLFWTDTCEAMHLEADCIDGNENCDVPSESCLPIGGGESDCGNEIDDDEDGNTDCEDVDCAAEPACCAPDKQIACGGSDQDDTTGGVNGYTNYSCTTLNEGGPEIIYGFKADEGCPEGWSVTATLSGMTADLDIFLLSACDPEACVDYSAGTSTENLNFAAEESQEFFLVVDGYGTAADAFDLSVTCTCGVVDGDVVDGDVVDGDVDPTSCEGRCGDYGYICSCDDLCVDFEDCCADVCDWCPSNPSCGVDGDAIDGDFIDGDFDNVCNEDCDATCMVDGYDYGVCVEDFANCFCGMDDCSNYECGNTYDSCSCSEADPCSWANDNWCDINCYTAFPDDHFNDDADCGIDGDLDGDVIDGDVIDGDFDLVCEGSCDGSPQSFCIDDDTLCWCDSNWAEYDCLDACIGAGWTGTLGCTFGAYDYPQCICTDADGDIDGDVVDGDVIDGDIEVQTSCEGRCGVYGGGCACDDLCSYIGDCCDDFCDWCPEVDPNYCGIDGDIIDGDVIDGDVIDGDVDLVCEGSCDGSPQSFCTGPESLCWCDIDWLEYDCLEACIGAGYSGTSGCYDGGAGYPQCWCTDADGDVDGDVIDGDLDLAYCPGYTGTSECCTLYNTCDWADDDWCDCGGFCEWDVNDCSVDGDVDGDTDINPDSCEDRCGDYGIGNCNCDDQCFIYQDCCDDICDYCSLPECLIDGDLVDGDIIDGDIIDGDLIDGDIVDGDEETVACGCACDWPGDDFEDGNLDDWTVVNGGAYSSIAVKDDMGAGGSASSLELLGGNGLWNNYLEKTFDSCASCEISFWVYPESCPVDSEMQNLVQFFNSEGAINIQFFIRQAGLTIANSQSSLNLGECVAQTWYQVKLLPNWEADTMDVYLDGNLIREDFALVVPSDNISKVRLFHFSPGSEGRFDEIMLKTECGPPPNGFTCNEPIPLNLDAGSVPGSTVGAGDQYQATCTFGNSDDIVYSFDLSEAKRVTFNALGFDTVMYMYEGQCGNENAEIACNDDNFHGKSTDSIFTVNLGIGNYYLVIDGFSSSGEFTLNIESLSNPCNDDPCPGSPECVPSGDWTDYECVCPAGTIPFEDDCVSDPCDPNPCTEENKNICEVDLPDAYTCSCNVGFIDDGNDGCIADPDANEWAFFVFLNADNNLEQVGYDDVGEMEVAGSTALVHIVTLFDTSSDDADRIYITQGGYDVIENVGEINMSDWHELADFGVWAVQNYPAQHTALIMWDHGAGWERRGGSPSDPLFKGFSNDDHGPGSADEISVAQGDYGYAMAAIHAALGEKLDIVGFDACLMGMWEVAEASAPYADYLVASEETEPVHGWSYDGFLPPLVADPQGTTPLQLAMSIVDTYHDYSEDNATLSVIDLNTMDALTAVLSNFANALVANKQSFSYSTIDSIRSDTQTFDWSFPEYRDIYDFARRVKAHGGVPAAVATSAQALMDQLDISVAYNQTNSNGGGWWGGDYTNAYGLSFYFPSRSDSFNSAYRAAGAVWSVRSTWDEFVYDFTGGK